MNSYSFFCYGHALIQGTHKKTLEFTKDKEVTEKGDCIIGVDSDFECDELKDFLNGKEKMKVVIECDGLTDEVECEVNPGFNSDHEIVIRKSDFISERTLGIRADKACSDLDRELIEKMKSKENKVKIILY